MTKIRWQMLKNRILCTRPALALKLLFGCPVAYRLVVHGGIVVREPHTSIVRCALIQNA